MTTWESGWASGRSRLFLCAENVPSSTGLRELGTMVVHFRSGEPPGERLGRSGHDGPRAVQTELAEWESAEDVSWLRVVKEWKREG